MMTTTLDRLRALRLGAMADAYTTQQQDAATATLSFDERLSMLVDAEHLYRGNRALTRRLKEAKLRLPQACVEDLDITPRRGLDRALARQLATGRWVAEHHHVLICGPTGVGKTYLACALAQQACRQGYRTLYRRVPRLFEELTLGPMARTRSSWPGWRASTCSSWMTGGWHPSARRSARTSWNCSKIARGRGPRLSPANSPASSGTTTWASPRSPMPFSTAWSIVRSRSR